jgi:hypothetical protein
MPPRQPREFILLRSVARESESLDHQGGTGLLVPQCFIAWLSVHGRSFVAKGQGSLAVDDAWLQLA